MIYQHEDESRADYLLRVLDTFMQTTYAGASTVEYDGAVCDGFCLADDIRAEVEQLSDK